MSSKSRSRTSSSMRQVELKRRSRSPRRKKQLSPDPPRRRGPIRGKRPPSSANYEDERHPPKRQRSPRNTSRTPSRQSPRRRRRAYSGSRDAPLDQPRGSQQFIIRDGVSKRLRSEDRYVVDRPLFRGPDKDVLMDRDSLKKIVVKMRDTPLGNDTIKRDIVNPEDINVVRRAVASVWSRNYHEVNNNQMPGLTRYESDWKKGSSSYGRSEVHDVLLQYTSEGSRPIFDRDEIVNYGRSFEESERERKRVLSRSPVHSGRRHGSSEGLRAREAFYEERNDSFREYSRGRPTRDHDSRAYDRLSDERSRYPPSTREYSLERSDRYDGRDDHRSFRWSPGRPVGRLRRRPSPRRRIDDYRPVRERSPERRDPSPDVRELSPGRGRGRGFSFRGRGLSGSRAFPRPAEIIMHPTPPVRPVRGALLPWVRGRRLPFPPRLVRPLVGPVIRVIAPVIPVRPPVLPVRPPVLPVRHPVIPLPF